MGGCACAGPYAHRLLGIDRRAFGALHAAIISGDELRKPGWTRLNLSALIDDAKADFIINAVDSLAADPYPMIDSYRVDSAAARFHPRSATPPDLPDPGGSDCRNRPGLCALLAAEDN